MGILGASGDAGIVGFVSILPSRHSLQRPQRVAPRWGLFFCAMESQGQGHWAHKRRRARAMEIERGRPL